MMSVFNTISVEIASMCNRKCKWCPVAYNVRPDERMPALMMDRVLNDLAALKYAGRVELYIYNEPARDMQYLLETIAKVRATVPRACIMIATNGDYFQRKGVSALVPLFEAGLNQLLINCYAKGLYEKRLPWVNELHLNHGVELTTGIYSYISPRRQAVQILDKHNPAAFGKGVFGLINRAGNIPKFIAASTAPLQRMCVKPFRILNINWKGDALVCCQDYHGEVKFGNVMNNSIGQIWNHPVLNEYRRRLLEKDRSLPLCRTCDCHAGAYPANVAKPQAPFASARTIEVKHYKEKQK